MNDEPLAHESAEPLRVLFLCTHNSSRSQMAEGLLKARGGARYTAFSAGTHPRTVHPYAVKVMADIGIDISEQAGHQAKGIDALLDQPPMDLVCAMRRQKNVPLFPGPDTRGTGAFRIPAPSLGLRKSAWPFSVGSVMPLQPRSIY